MAIGDKMIYHTMCIKENKNGFECFTFKSNVDREETKTVPSVMGFYHFPETMDEQKAKQKLKECLIKEYKKEILRLQNNVDSLMKL
jgi:hypothetical protein